MKFPYTCMNILLITAAQLNAAAQTPVHYLKPPKLSSQHLGERVLCHRPMRQEAPKIGIETYADKTIVHNYGHGGNGWTLAPGCVSHLLQKFNEQVTVQRDDPLIVIGAGIMGLLTTHMLLKSGYTNITIIAEQFDNLASHKAGGFCAPTSASGASVDAATQTHISNMGIEAYKFYAGIACEENEDFDPLCARFVPVYMQRSEHRLEAYEGIVMNEPEDVIVNFSNGKEYEMKVYADAIFMDTQRMMLALMQLIEGKVTHMQQRIGSFDEINTANIFSIALALVQEN